MSSLDTNAIREALQALGLSSGKSGKSVKIQHHSTSLFPLYRAETADSVIAVKVVRSFRMAQTEQAGLEALSEAGCRVPKPYGVYETQGLSLLLMQFIETGKAQNMRENLLENLSRLYSQKEKAWGWHEDNFIGSLSQPNHRHATFADFWWQDRIGEQLEKAISSRRMRPESLDRAREIVYRKSEDWGLNEYVPRLIHGDLWSGNVLAAKDGSYLIDPSVAAGHPEQDLAMLDLFGSVLSHAEMEHLSRSMGMSAGLVDRIPFWQLYPLLVHVNIFGGSYAASAERVLQRYAR